MASQINQIGLARLLLRATKFRRQGFTLLELLVAMIMGAILISGLLYIAVELLGVNRREEALTQTQQDMKRAIDYITQDAREAVYVYSAPGITDPDTNTFTPFSTLLDDLPAGATPILAFWRIDPVDIPASLDCSAVAAAKEAECNTLKIRQAVYTLVVYLQEDNTGNDIWEGPSRIIRYELPKYSNLANLTQTPGYVDPTSQDSSFEAWAPSGTVNAPSSAVLADSVDFLATDQNPTCPANYDLTPAGNTSFYVCVLSNNPLDAADVLDQGRSNQSLLVYLRGNATEGQGRGGLMNTNSEEGRLPTLESQILIRGVLDKQG